MKLFFKSVSFVFIAVIIVACNQPVFVAEAQITTEPLATQPQVVGDLLSIRANENKQVPCNWYIFTGGPGTGKTCVLQELASRGYVTVPEAATDIIAQELKDGEIAPWSKVLFEVKVAELMAERQAKLLDLGVEIAFFDRGPVDPLSYILWYKKPVNNDAVSALNKLLASGNFMPTVFVFQDLGVCENTGIRHESVAEMLQIEDRLVRDYESLGFSILKVPRASIKDRADFILTQIGVHEGKKP